MFKKMGVLCALLLGLVGYLQAKEKSASSKQSFSENDQLEIAVHKNSMHMINGAIRTGANINLVKNAASLVNNPSYVEMDFGTLISRDTYFPGGINCLGQVFGTHLYNVSNEYGSLQVRDIFLWDIKHGLRILKSPLPQIGRFPESISAALITEKGQLIGHFGFNLFTWDDQAGFRFFSINDLFGDRFRSVELINVNSAGDVLVVANGGRNDAWSQTVFVWNNKDIREVNLQKALSDIGAIPSGIRPVAINDRGQIVGVYTNNRRHKYTDELVRLGEQSFYYDGKAHIIPVDVWNPKYTLGINNDGKVLIVHSECNETEHKQVLTTSLWSLEDGLTLLGNFIGKSLNDVGQVLGCLPVKLKNNAQVYVDCLWDGSKSLLFINKGSELPIPSYSSVSVSRLHQWDDVYSDEPICKSGRCFLKLTNNGLILSTQAMEGKSHPVVLYPRSPNSHDR